MDSNANFDPCAQFEHDFPSYYVKANNPKEDIMNYITIVRGKLKPADEKAAQSMHDATVDKLSEMTRPMGAIGHHAYLNPQNHKEFLAVDTWNNLEGLQGFMSNPQVAEEFGKLFDGMPDISIWTESGWASFSE
jgi:quinol monooxygenase YgiN